jgi:hypothetical protein
METRKTKDQIIQEIFDKFNAMDEKEFRDMLDSWELTPWGEAFMECGAASYFYEKAKEFNENQTKPDH